jgi:hypothetical protein
VNLPLFSSVISPFVSRRLELNSNLTVPLLWFVWINCVWVLFAGFSGIWVVVPLSGVVIYLGTVWASSVMAFYICAVFGDMRLYVDITSRAKQGTQTVKLSTASKAAFIRPSLWLVGGRCWSASYGSSRARTPDLNSTINAYAKGMSNRAVNSISEIWTA